MWSKTIFIHSLYKSGAFDQHVWVKVSSIVSDFSIGKFPLPIYTVDLIYRSAWGPSSASAIYPDRDISRSGSLPRRR